MRDQLMAGPLPRSMRKSKATREGGGQPRRGGPAQWKRVGVWVLACCATALLVVAAVRAMTASAPEKPQPPADREREIAGRLEKGSDWFDSPAGGPGRKVRTIEEAKVAGMGATHTPQKTSLMRISLRKLTPVAAGDGPRPGATSTEPPEGGAMVQAPSTPAPRPTDSQGRVLPGTGGDTVKPDEPSEE